MIKIIAAHVEEDGLEFKQEQTAKDLDLDIENVKFTTPLRISGLVTKAGSDFLIKGGITGQTELTCGRCLEQFKKQLTEKFEHYHKWKNEVEIDITDQMREAVILSFSIKLVCGTECKGLCPMCGQNLNIKDCGCKPTVKGTLEERIEDLD